MATTETAAPAANFDPAKRYAVTLSRVVEHEGFVIRPGKPEPVISGELANEIAASIADYREAGELPAPRPLAVMVYESAEGVTTIVDPSA